MGEEIPPLPYNLHTQQYISDKSIADAVEALIGAHLLTLGPQPTLKVGCDRFLEKEEFEQLTSFGKHS